MKFKVGDVVKLGEEVDLYPHALVPRGETGVVVEVNDDEVVVAMHDHYEGLDEWDNRVYFAANQFNNPDQRPLARWLEVTLSRDVDHVDACRCDIKQLFDVGHSVGCVDHPDSKRDVSAHKVSLNIKNFHQLMDALESLGIKV